MSPQLITEVTKGRSQMSWETVKLVGETHEINAHWLWTGEGEMTTPVVSETATTYQVTAVHTVELRPDQAELLEYYEQMCPDQRDWFLMQARGFVDASRKSGKKGEEDGGSKVSNCA